MSGAARFLWLPVQPNFLTSDFAHGLFLTQQLNPYCTRTRSVEIAPRRDAADTLLGIPTFNCSQYSIVNENGRMEKSFIYERHENESSPSWPAVSTMRSAFCEGAALITNWDSEIQQPCPFLIPYSPTVLAYLGTIVTNYSI